MKAHNHLHSAVHGFWLVEELVEVVDRCAGCGELSRVVYICLGLQCDQASCTYGGGEKDHCKPNAVIMLVTYIPSIPFENSTMAKNQALHYNNNACN
jgi:hypothetical protein